MAKNSSKSVYKQRKIGSVKPKKAELASAARKNKKTLKSGKKSKNKRKKPRWKKALKIIGFIFLGLAIAIAAVFIWFSKDLPSSEEILSGRLVDQATQIYDRTGEHVLYEIHGDENRTLIKLDDLPDHTLQATIAIEDDDFYNHPGFDVNGIVRAVFKNLQGQEYAQGGSTITQQLIKNTILTPEKTFTRKVKELVLATELEWKLSKDEILELYLNAIPYGSTAYGVEAASQTFFSKPASELTLAESAMIAGLPQAPTYYSPIQQPDRAKVRQEAVLDRMAELGYITEKEAEEAKDEEINIVVQRADITAPHFVDYIRGVLIEEYGIKKVETGGLKVITTLDLDKQVIAEETIAAHAPEILEYDAHNAALVSVDTATGEILSMVGSVDYFAEDESKKLDGQVNVVTSLRSPGSSIKPLDYVTLFTRGGYNPSTILYDLATSFGDDGSGKEYKPQNYTGGFSGPVSIRTALQQSLNIPAIKAYYLAGPANVSTMASKMGYDNWVAGKEYGLATAIGGHEVTPLDHVGMFATFANRGKKHDPVGILEVTDPNGETLQAYDAAAQEEKILDENIADTMSNMLSDNNARSWGRRELVLADRPFAAKTGTSNKDIGNGIIKPDNVWTCGYTPQVATAVWVGNNDGSVMSGQSTGLLLASPILQDYMNQAMADYEVADFVEPEPIKADKPILMGKTGKETEVEICKPSGLLANEYCPDSMREKKTFRNVHSILYYVNKENPTGPAPKNPEADPQFKSWEGAVRGWANTEEAGGEAPTEVDTLHNPEFWPTVSITSPGSGETVTSGLFTVSANAHGQNPINEVVYSIDGHKVAASSSPPFGASITLPGGITNGFHSLTATVYDNIDNKGETNINLNFKVSNIKPTVQMTGPVSGTEASPGSSMLFSASAQGTPGVDRVEFFVQDPSGQSRSIGGDSSSDASGNYGMSWSAPTSGTYYAYAKVSDSNGNTAQSGKVTITIK
ncbi:penicillin-binding protein [Patescibacteria group bacterium]